MARRRRRWLPRRRFGYGWGGLGKMLTYAVAIFLALCILTGGKAASFLSLPSSVHLDLENISEVRSIPAPSGSFLEGLGDFFTGLLDTIFGEEEQGPDTWETWGSEDNLQVQGDQGYIGRPSYVDYIPTYTGESYVWLEGRGDFTREEFSRVPYEYYGPLDSLGRPTVAEALLDPSLMPNEEREPIGMVRPVGWHTVKYDCIEDRYLYNRCHLIGFQLTGENANERNLITGTRYLNVRGMLPWENLLADYVKRSGDQCLYRVTPIYEGNNLIASGLHMEAESVLTDDLWFNIYVFNVQPGVGIDYRNGDSWEE